MKRTIKAKVTLQMRLVGRGGTAGEECGESKAKIQPEMMRRGKRSAAAAT